MSKKLLCLLIVLLMVCASGLTAAQGAPASKQVFQVQRQAWAGVRPKTVKIKQNEASIRQLKASIEKKTVLLRRKINAARRNPEQLSGQQIAALRTGASTLAANKRLLAADQGAFAKKMAAMRKHKRTGNCQAVLADLEAIIALQQARLKNLQAVSAALDDLLMAF